MPATLSVDVVRGVSPARRWLTQAEAADYIGVTDRTIRNYISRGVLPASRVRGGRIIRIDVHDVDKLLSPIPAAGRGHA